MPCPETAQRASGPRSGEGRFALRNTIRPSDIAGMSVRPRILVTRSEPGASETAARLAALGYDAVTEPVFAVESLPAALPAFNALALTSPNGVRAFASASPVRDVPVYAVGARTADIARQHGFTDVISADGDVVALTQLIRERLSPADILLHAGNAHPSGDLSGDLRAAGLRAVHVALYQAVPTPRAGPALAAHLSGDTPLDAVLIHSPRGAAILAAHIDAIRHRTLQPSLPALVSISAAARRPLESYAERHAVARTPDENALLEALRDLLHT